MNLRFVKLCVGGLMIATTPLYAQEKSANVQKLEALRYQRQLHLSTTFVGSIDLAHHSDNPAARIFGEPPSVAPAEDIRLTHLCGARWGWYADFRVKYYVSKLEHSDFLEGFVSAISPSSYFHIGYSVGGVYRLEGTRWQCYPRVGIGQNFYGYNRKKESDGELRLESDGKTFCMDVGIMTQYRLTPRFAITFDVLYRQPLTSAESYLLLETETGIQPYSYRSSTLGRELNVGIGINFCFSLKKK